MILLSFGGWETIVAFQKQKSLGKLIGISPCHVGLNATLMVLPYNHQDVATMAKSFELVMALQKVSWGLGNCFAFEVKMMGVYFSHREGFWISLGYWTYLMRILVRFLCIFAMDSLEWFYFFNLKVVASHIYWEGSCIADSLTSHTILPQT